MQLIHMKIDQNEPFSEKLGYPRRAGSWDSDFWSYLLSL